MFSYDNEHDVYTLNGMKITGDFVRALDAGDGSKLYRFYKRRDGAVTVEHIGTLNSMVMRSLTGDKG